MLTRVQAEPFRLAPEAIEPARSEALAFQAVYEAWFDEVSRWVRALGGPEADCDDLVQEVFLIVHRRLHAFDGKNLGGWLYRIARRRVRDFRRLLWVKRIFSRSEPLSDRLYHPGSDPAESYETKERGRLLEQLLARLNADQRAAFVLFEIEGRSGEEIARIQGVPINTVWARIHKARQKLVARVARLERA